jgi:tetratricopeptide (TPR) repeat protein
MTWLRQFVERLRARRVASNPATAEVPPPAGPARAAEYRPIFEAGVAAFHAGRYEEAERHFERCVELRGDDADAHLNLGISCQRLGRREDAADSFGLALRHRPDFAEAWFNLGTLELERGAHEPAAAALQEAVRLKPDYAPALSNLGYVQFKYLGLAEAGEENLRGAVRAQPGYAPARLNLGMLLQERGLPDKALSAYQEALRREPDLAEARLNSALIHLARGDFARGWPLYEARKGGSTHFTPRHFPYPEWDGRKTTGTVLVYGEQGLGDEMMFASCLPDVIERAGRCVIDCTPKLERLFRRSFPTALVHGGRQDATDGAWLERAGPIDFQVAIGSLPRLFRTSRATFPAHHGYLKADEAAVERWRVRLRDLGPGSKVGISWRGGTVHTRSRLRSIELAQLLPLLRTPGARFVSLQYGDCGDELARLARDHGVTVEHWPDALADYDQTAALVSAFDLVISVQTAAVHLAGALGRPVWALVPAVAEWRYMEKGSDNPWYPSLRVFRQQAPFSWQATVDNVAVELARLAR